VIVQTDGDLVGGAAEPEGSGQCGYISDRTVEINVFCNNMMFVNLLRT